MRTANCRNVRREIEEVAGERLSLAASTHVQECAACGLLHEQQSKLRTIMGNLGTIEAPGDFDFKLRARLAREKSRQPASLLGGFSFGVRSAALASLLVLFGSVMFIAFRSNTTVEPPVATIAPSPTKENKPAEINSLEVAAQPQALPVPFGSASDVRQQPRTLKPRGSRSSSRDFASSTAKVRPSELNARAGEFPIDGSRQPLKVSLDDGRGSSRTISLPAVSFGSQRVLSQNSSPLMASARGSW